MRVRAAIVEEVNRPPELTDVELEGPIGDEVLVRIEAAGVCHTDLSCASGVIGAVFPAVLGHEGAGTVEAVGPDVRRVKPGDRVVISIAHHCGHCYYCEAGYAPLCVERGDSRPRLTRGGRPVSQTFGTGTFTEATVVREISAVAVPDGVPLDVAAVSGCAAITGLGAALNVAKVKPGARVAVIGCGAVGACAVMGARLAGAEQIVAVDLNAERRLAMLELGATDAVAPDALELNVFDYAFEAAGQPASLKLAFEATRQTGETLLLGLPRGDVEFSVPAFAFVVGARRVTGVNLGSFRPNIDFDAYFRLYLRGRLPLDRLVSAKLPLESAAEAFERATRGEGLRILMSPN